MEESESDDEVEARSAEQMDTSSIGLQRTRVSSIAARQKR